MADKREELLAQLEAALATVAGVVTCVRNRGLLRDEQRPAIVILDGDEQTDVQALPSRTANMAKSMVTAKPEIFFLSKEYRPVNKKSDEKNIGTVLNEARAAVTAKIAGDSVIRGLLGPNGRLQYTGCITDLKSGSALSGEMRMDFSFTYVFDPNA